MEHTPEMTKVENDQGSVITGRGSDGQIAVTVFDLVTPNLVSPQLASAYLTVQAATDQLSERVTSITVNSHPAKVNGLVTIAITQTMRTPFRALVAAGVSDKRANDEAYGRAAAPTEASNPALRDQLQRQLLNATPATRLQMLTSPDAPVGLLAVGVSLADAGLLGLDAEITADIECSFIVANAAEKLAVSSPKIPSANAAFATGPDMASAIKLAEAQLVEHTRRVDAVDLIEVSTGRLVTMLTVVSGNTDVDTMWNSLMK